jgi:hypothetical protein
MVLGRRLQWVFSVVVAELPQVGGCRVSGGGRRREFESEIEKKRDKWEEYINEEMIDRRKGGCDEGEMVE